MIDFSKITDKSYIYAKKSKPLKGIVQVGGAKNMVTKIMTAALIATEGELTIHNVPLISEVFITLELFDQLGIDYAFKNKTTLVIRPSKFETSKIDFQKNDGNRISILFAGPIIKRFRKATIAKPKGCKIGTRKIDYHIFGLEQFGIKIKDKNDSLEMSLKGSGLRGADLELPFPSVGATENFIITAACAKGKTTIKNCAIEPEISELIAFLQKCGIKIDLSFDRTIRIEGKDKIDLGKASIDIMPDRIEAISYAALALSTKGDIFVKGARVFDMEKALKILDQMGAGIDVKDDGIRFYYEKPLSPASLTTEVYPGLPTDFQQPFAILLSQVKGTSLIHETIFENRFEYLNRLNSVIRKGKKFAISDKCPDPNCRFASKDFKHMATIDGSVEFGKGELTIPDLRAGFALLNAACLSDGITIHNIGLLFRGYEDPVAKLRRLGANIKLVY